MERFARRGEQSTRAYGDGVFAQPRACLDDEGWIPWPEVRSVLCLAAGGGQQGPLFASLGLEVTVVDISPAGLETDREVAHRRGLAMETVEADMLDLSQLHGQGLTSSISRSRHSTSQTSLPSIERCADAAPRGLLSRSALEYCPDAGGGAQALGRYGVSARASAGNWRANRVGPRPGRKRRCCSFVEPDSPARVLDRRALSRRVCAHPFAERGHGDLRRPPVHSST